MDVCTLEENSSSQQNQLINSNNKTDNSNDNNNINSNASKNDNNNRDNKQNQNEKPKPNVTESQKSNSSLNQTNKPQNMPDSKGITIDSSSQKLGPILTSNNNLGVSKNIQSIDIPKTLTSSVTDQQTKSAEIKSNYTSSSISNTKTSRSTSSSEQKLPSKSVLTSTAPKDNTVTPSSNFTNMNRSSSVQVSTKTGNNNVQSMKRTTSINLASKSNSRQNTSSPPPTHFHPIAIKPKPIQPMPSKGRSKTNSISKSHSTSNSSKDQTKSSDNAITLTTSKNWVLPPRPKTKKATKKKEKKPVSKLNSNTNNISNIQKSVASNSSSNSNVSSVKMQKKVSVPSPLKNKSNAKSLASATQSNTTLKGTKASVDGNKLRSESASATNSSKSSTSKYKECSNCNSSRIDPEIRSIYLDPSSGKVSINAQIHSNINLYTNDEGELGIQLQHVTRENDNLKKILLKLNKEIQNLKLVKQKEEQRSLQTDHTTNSNKNGIKSDSSSCVLKPKVKVTSNIKSEVVDFDLDKELSIEHNKSQPPGDNANKLLPVLFDDQLKTANTIDPVNLSYNLESKRQKVTSLSPEILSTNIRPSLVKPLDSKLDTEDSSSNAQSARQESSHQKQKSNSKGKGCTKKKTSTSEATIQATVPVSVSDDHFHSTNNDNGSGSGSGNGNSNSNINNNVKKQYHPCEFCEIGQNCICSEKQSLSIAANLAKILSRAGFNLLGLGGLNNPSINTVNKNIPGKINGLSTLTAILKREEIMKKLKDDDKEALSNLLKSESKKPTTTKDEKDNLNDILSELNKSNHANEVKKVTNLTTNKMENANDRNVGISPTDHDYELLQMIDSEMLLDPTPIVDPILLKKDKNATKGVISTNPVAANNAFFGRGALVDFNSFTGGDPMLDEDVMMFDTIPVSTNNLPNIDSSTNLNANLTTANSSGDLIADIDKVLMEPLEPIDDTDEFMIY